MSRHGNKVRLGKKTYTIYRNVENGEGMYDEYGEEVKGKWVKVKIRANYQGSLVYNKQRFLDSGEINKECLSIRSNEPIYKARMGTNKELLQADLIEYDGALWEVRETIPYFNLRDTAHTEVLAVRLDETPIERFNYLCGD